jgi:hypothetical protein
MEIPMKKIMLFLAVAYCAFMLNGCAVYKASVDERPIKTIYNDEVITANIMAAYLKDDAKKILDISPAEAAGHRTGAEDRWSPLCHLLPAAQKSRQQLRYHGQY